jgi:hypothetical protein
MERMIDDWIIYMMSMDGYTAKQKALLLVMGQHFRRQTMLRASSRYLRQKINSSRPTVLKILKRLEGPWLSIERCRGKLNIYRPSRKFARLLARRRR